MKAFNKLMGLSSLVLVLGMIAASHAFGAIAEASNLQVTTPLDVGGTVLQPGDYVIRVVPRDTNRNVLRVTNEDGSEVFATVLSVPHALGSAQQKGDTSFVYYPAVGGSPQALRTWFAPDSTSGGGHDIVYPKARAMELAAALSEPVVAHTDVTMPEELETAELVVVTPEKEVAPYAEPTPTPEPMEVASSYEMPRTAGRVPLFGMIGVLLLGMAIGIHTFRAK